MTREEVVKARAEKTFPKSVYVYEEDGGPGNPYLDMNPDLMETVDKETRTVAEYRLVRFLKVTPVTKVEEL